MTVYTNIAKPSATSYTNLNPLGKQTFDDVTVSYDDTVTTYDGTDVNLYTNITKPVGTSYTNISKPS